jgi:predicted nucleotidyltransferase
LSGSAPCWPTTAWSSSSSLDLLGSLEPIGTYDDLLPHAETVPIGGHPTRAIGLDDLIRIKRYIGRPKDRESLLHLEAIKRLREQEGLR